MSFASNQCVLLLSNILNKIVVALQSAACRAPELIDDEVDVSRAGIPSDVWSLAAVLLHCLTGVAPYSGMRSMEMRRALLLRHSPGPIPEDLPNQLQVLLRQCFQAEPADRPGLPHIKQVC